MQQYMLHRLQEKHRLIIQLLLLIVLILSHQNATQVYRSCRRRDNLAIALFCLVSFYSAGPNFHCQTKKKSFLLLNLKSLPFVTPSFYS